ncbi:MAG: ATP-binding protein [Phenylobacterium sp.]
MELQDQVHDPAQDAHGPPVRRGVSARLSRQLMGFVHLRTKLTVSYLTLFLFVLFVILTTVYVSVARNAEQAVRDELTASATVFERIWQMRTTQLQNGAELLSRDFGFRAAVATQDGPTIQSALVNLRRRLGFDLAFVIGPDGSLIAADDASDRADATALLRRVAQGDSSDGVFVLSGVPYQAVSAPVMAPTPVGQVVFAVRLDQREMASLVRLSPIAFHPQVLIREPNGRWVGAARTLSKAELANVGAALAKAGPDGRATGQRAIRIGQSVEVVRPLRALGAEQAALLLSYPLSKALAPYRGLLATVLALGAAGVGLIATGSWMLARAVTRPLAALRQAAERLERGEGGAVAVEGVDEIAALGVTFNRMADRILRREEALERARAHAESSNRAKSDFLANMSHEIRTPLNGVLGMAQVMARDTLKAKQRERLQVIQESGDALLAILSSILDLSKIEAGHMVIEAHDFDLDEVVRMACGPFVNLALQKGFPFDITVEPDAAGSWRGDSLRLRQVLSNLASNAVKFTETGGVALYVQTTRKGLAFELRDTGAGIPPERLGEVFDKFSQMDSSSTRRVGGTGLGLAISRELVQLMGGQLTVVSTLGKGSIFRFRLPLERIDPAHDLVDVASAAIPRGPKSTLRVLAAEDNKTNQLILAALLDPLDADLTLVADGHEAVEAFTVGQFDVVLMDIQMPVMSGVEATRAIRRLEATRIMPRTPILALSANVMTHQVGEYLAAGMDAVVPKPLQAEVLFAAIEKALGQPTAPAGRKRAAG